MSAYGECLSCDNNIYTQNALTAKCNAAKIEKYKKINKKKTGPLAEERMHMLASIRSAGHSSSSSSSHKRREKSLAHSPSTSGVHPLRNLIKTKYHYITWWNDTWRAQWKTQVAWKETFFLHFILLFLHANQLTALALADRPVSPRNKHEIWDWTKHWMTQDVDCVSFDFSFGIRFAVAQNRATHAFRFIICISHTAAADRPPFDDGRFELWCLHAVVPTRNRES